MITLILVIFFLVVCILLTIVGGNYALRHLVDSALGKKETFENPNQIKKKIIDSMDDCKQIDKFNTGKLNMQTGTNIPLSPNTYEDYVGIMYDDIKNPPNNELKDGNYCLYKDELLYDGIWKSKIAHPRPGYEKQEWTLTNGNVMNDYYCSNKLVQLNKKIPNDYVDQSAVYDDPNVEKITYFNDCKDDPYDIELSCFPPIFNKGITSTTKNFDSVSTLAKEI